MSFELFSFISIVVWSLLGLKLVMDDLAFLKGYRKIINRPFPILSKDKRDGVSDIEIFANRLKIARVTYPESPRT